MHIYGLPPLPPTSLTRQTADGPRRSIFDDVENFEFLSKNWFLNVFGGHWRLRDFENFDFLSKIWFLHVFGGHWRLGDSGNFNFFDFGSISKFCFFLIFWVVGKFWWEATALCLWVSV